MAAASASSSWKKVYIRAYHVRGKWQCCWQYAEGTVSYHYTSQPLTISNITTMSSDPSLDYTLPFQLTKTIHRDVYDLVSPDNPANSQKGKIIVITGGGTGICAVRISLLPPPPKELYGVSDRKEF